jgi:hypothetical protein
VLIQSISPAKSSHVTICSVNPNQLARNFLGEVWMYKLSLFLLRDLLTRDESIFPRNESISPRCALLCIFG